MSTPRSKFIGSGLVFPIVLDSITTTPIIRDDFELIRSSIGIILNWPDRDRFFNEEFGSRVFELLEEPDNNVARALLSTFIKEALEKWERRILVKSLSFDIPQGNASMTVSIVYQVKNTKLEDTFIYPFYSELKY